jgi:hypothetical protein
MHASHENLIEHRIRSRWVCLHVLLDNADFQSCTSILARYFQSCTSFMPRIQTHTLHTNDNTRKMSPRKFVNCSQRYNLVACQIQMAQRKMVVNTWTPVNLLLRWQKSEMLCKFWECACLECVRRVWATDPWCFWSGPAQLSFPWRTFTQVITKSIYM